MGGGQKVGLLHIVTNDEIYTKQIATALQLLDSTGSPRKVIEILGDPSNPMLYH